MSSKREFPDEYGKNKKKIEEILKNSDINYTILKPSIIYGRGSTSFDFIINLIDKLPFFVPIIGSGKYFISPVHINDIIKTIEQCIQNKKTDKKEYDLPGGTKIYFIQLINELKKNIKCNKKNIYIPLFLCKIFVLIFPFVISKENLANLTQDSFADISLIKEDLNYQPLEFSEGIKNGII